MYKLAPPGASHFAYQKLVSPDGRWMAYVNPNRIGNAGETALDVGDFVYVGGSPRRHGRRRRRSPVRWLDRYRLLRQIGRRRTLALRRCDQAGGTVRNECKYLFFHNLLFDCCCFL